MIDAMTDTATNPASPTTGLNPIGKMTCPACASTRLSAKPFAAFGAIIVACKACEHKYEIPFAQDDEDEDDASQEQPAKPEPKPQDDAKPEPEDDEPELDDDDTSADDVGDGLDDGAEDDEAEDEAEDDESDEDDSEDDSQEGSDGAGDQEANDTEAEGDQELDDAPEGQDDEGQGAGQDDAESDTESQELEPEESADEMSGVSFDNGSETEGDQDDDASDEIVLPDTTQDDREAAINRLGDQEADTTIDESAAEELEPARELDAKAIEDMKTRAFYRRIGDVLKDNQNERHVPGKRSGKLYERHLYKVPTGTGRVFSKREERKNKHYNVLLLIDASLSMVDFIDIHEKRRYREFYNSQGRGYNAQAWRSYTEFGNEWQTRIKVAAGLARLMVEGLSKHGIDFQVSTFHSRVRTFKGWGDRKPNLDDLERLIVEEAERGSGTHTYQAMIAAEEAFATRHDGHNVIIVITDGQPDSHDVVTDKHTGARVNAGTGLNRNTGQHQLPGLVRKISKQTADVIAIGVGCKEVKAWFHNAHIVNNREEFMSAMLKQFSRLVVRG